MRNIPNNSNSLTFPIEIWKSMFSLDVITLAELTTCAATKDCSAVTIEDTLDACNSEATELCEVER